MKRLDIIDFLKGYSIFTIILFHYLQFLPLEFPFNHLVYFGGTGIHLFILLSGFGLYLSSSRKSLSYIAFLKKRFTKIYLPYIPVVLISFAISLVLPIYEPSLYALAGHIFLYKMFDESIIGSYGYALWFVSMIIQFYLVYPFLKGLFDKFGILLLLISVVISILWATLIVYLGVQDDRVWNSFFLQYLWEFVLGMYLAKKLTEKPEFYSRFSIYKLLLLAVLFLAGSLLITFYGGPTIRVYNDFLLLPAYGFLAVFVYKLMLKPVNWFFNFTGEISYSLFLWHMLFLNLTVYLLGKSLVFLLISLLLTYLVSYAYNRWFVGKVLA